MGDRRAGMLLALVGALFFHEVLGGRRLYAVDLHQTYEPLRHLLGGSLLWTGRLHAGMPLLANPMAGVAYPLNFIPLGSPATALSLLTVLHVLLGGLGAFVLARAWRLTLAAAWCAGAVFAFNGITVAATAYPNLCWSVAWLPWLFLGWQRAAEARGWLRAGAVALVAIAAAALVAQGEAFNVLGAAIGLALVGLREAVLSVRGKPVPRVRALLLPMLAGGAVAALALAPFLAASFRYLPHTERGAGFAPEGLVYWSAHPAIAVGLAVPRVFGDPERNGAERFWADALVPEKGFPLLAGFYLGSASLVLVLLGAATGHGRRWPLVAWAALLLLLALGRYGPLYWILARIPGSDTLRFPMKWLVPATLPLALLAGRGLDALVERKRLALGLVAGLLVFLALLAVGAASFASLGTAHPASAALAVHRIQRSALLGALPLVGLAGLLLAGPRALRFAGLVGALLVAADLTWANRSLAPTVPAEFYRSVPPVVAALRANGAAVGRVWVESPMYSKVRLVPPPSTFAARARWEREVLLGYSGASYGLDLAFSMDVGHFRPRLHAQLASMIHAAPPREKLMLLGAGAVTHLVHHTPIADAHAELERSFPGATDRPLLLSRNRLAVPRVRVVPRVIPYDGTMGFMRAVQSGPDDLFLGGALVAREDAVPAPPGTGGPGTASLREDEGSLLRVQVTGGGGFLIVADSFVPGWTATEDGRPVPLFRADYAFRAVPVSAGTHEIVLRYSLTGSPSR